MTQVELFPRDQRIGVFSGFREGGLEYRADLTIPYRPDLENIPMHGQFVLVQLENPFEAVLGRIVSLWSGGKLASGSGEDYNIRAVQEDRAIPDDLREQYLRYRVNIRVLGVFRSTREGFHFVASHRRLPHVGSPVAFPSTEVLRRITGHDADGTTIGHLALGEYFYGPVDPGPIPAWMQVQPDEVRVTFSVKSLVSRRTFIFARAGFGKSNLNKLLFSQLYKTTPLVQKRGGRQVPVGTILFDPDGEYFWPDDRGRPGLCDVPGMEDHLVVFTSRKGPSKFYQSFVASGIRLDIRRLRPSDVIAIALPSDRQEQQNVMKLRALNEDRWHRLVDLIYAEGLAADLDTIKDLLRLEKSQDPEALAARANASRIVKMLHDPSSQLMDMIMGSLSTGKLCVVDVSQLNSGQALILSGLILRKIFDHNQEQFTEAAPKTIPTIAVVEEAQAVLNERVTAAEPYIAWVKEGRKYDLGAVLITQQPGSIPNEILSQGDNWFLFHLLSSQDLRNVRTANAHFGQDLLSTLLNEPIPGQGLFWSSVATPYPVPIRVISFETMYKLQDPNYTRNPKETFAGTLRARAAAPFGDNSTEVLPTTQRTDLPTVEGTDLLQEVHRRATEHLKGSDLYSKIRDGDGVPWGALNTHLMDVIPQGWANRSDEAYKLVPIVLKKLFGIQDHGWQRFVHPETGNSWVRAINGGDGG